MAEKVNIYCDESCHLENDGIPVMVLGAVWVPESEVGNISTRLRQIKRDHNLSDKFELKWSKVSPGQLAYYRAVIDYFFDSPLIRFRGLVVPDKAKLKHEKFNQNHDDWYYKMYFVMLKQILRSEASFNIYIDIKDTKSIQKVHKLHDVICSSIFDFDKDIISRVQQIRSHESEILQVADLLSGAIGYANRGLDTSQAKLELVDRIRKRTRFSLIHSTLPSERTFNLFIWSPTESD